MIAPTWCFLMGASSRSRRSTTGMRKLLGLARNAILARLHSRQRLPATCHSLDDDIGILHEHGNRGVLDGRRLDKAHGIDGFEDPFGQRRRQRAAGAILLRLRRHGRGTAAWSWGRDVVVAIQSSSRWAQSRLRRCAPGRSGPRAKCIAHRHTVHVAARQPHSAPHPVWASATVHGGTAAKVEHNKTPPHARTARTPLALSTKWPLPPAPTVAVPSPPAAADSSLATADDTGTATDTATDSDANVAATPHRYAHCSPAHAHDAVPVHRESLLVHLARLISSACSSRAGVPRAAPLPSFPTCWRNAMATSRQYQVPNTPRIISPSPTPSEAGGSNSQDGYVGPTTRSSARKQQQQQQQRIASPQPIDEDPSSSDPDQRARAKSRDAAVEGGLARRRSSGLTSRRQGKASASLTKVPALPTNGAADAHLSPAAANKQYWREMSRSPSPLGLIPIHQKWRSFVRTQAPRVHQDALTCDRFTVMRSRASSSTSPSAS